MTSAKSARKLLPVFFSRFLTSGCCLSQYRPIHSPAVIRSRLEESRLLWQFYWDMAEEENWIKEMENILLQVYNNLFHIRFPAGYRVRYQTVRLAGFSA